MKKGFTLIELMIAAAILVIALVGLLAAYTGCFGLNETARNLTIAMSGAQKEMEKIRNLAFSQISAEDGNSFEIAGIADADSEGVIEVDSSNPDLLVVTVTVCWRQKGGRVIGEDNGSGGGTLLNGNLDGTEDTNGNNILDSPAQIVTLFSER